MGKVIKVIDLLNMVAKGEKTPKRIKYAGYIFGRSDDDRYYTFFDEEDYQTNHLMEYVRCSDMNDEVEILDEEDEIDIQELGEMQNPKKWKAIDADITSIVININRLTKAVKQLDNKLKEK